MIKANVNDITKDDFKRVLELAMNGEVTNIAPLGFSSSEIYLYHNKTEGKAHSGCVKIRTWCNMPELLIGNKAGRWLCHLSIDRIMGLEYIFNEFYRQFENVKHLIDRYDRDENEVKVSENVSYTAGWDILHSAISKED